MGMYRERATEAEEKDGKEEALLQLLTCIYSTHKENSSKRTKKVEKEEKEGSYCCAGQPIWPLRLCKGLIWPNRKVLLSKHAPTLCCGMTEQMFQNDCTNVSIINSIQSA